MQSCEFRIVAHPDGFPSGYKKSTPALHTGFMLTEILPPGVMTVETYAPFSGSLLGPEEDAISGAIPERRTEFAAGRTCAREALSRLGLPAQPIRRGPVREPLWPAGICGSITHCSGYCAAAVARVDSYSSLGIDAEPNEPLPADALRIVASDDELALLRALPKGEIHWQRLLFSAKESVFKAFYPLTHQWLGFLQVFVRFAPDQQSFEASLNRESTRNAPLLWRGQFAAADGYLATAVVLPPR